MSRAVDNARKRTASGKEMARNKRIKLEPKEEVKREEKPYICPIYRRDIASFLPRWTIEKWRLTSRLSNGSLIEFPASLPRFVHPGLKVVVASANRCGGKNYLGFLGDVWWMEGNAFQNVYKFRLCCRELKAKASALVGQRVFPQMPADEGVGLVFRPHNVKTPITACRVPNELTKRTAPVLLHFLHHMKQLAFEHLDIDVERATTTDPEQCVFNAAILQALRPATAVPSKKRDVLLRAVKFGRSTQGRGQLTPATVWLADEMGMRYNCLSYDFDGDRPMLQQLLDFIATGRESVGDGKRLDVALVIQYNSILVDLIVQHFFTDVPRLTDAVRDVHFSTAASFPIHGWPDSCPREDESLEMQVRDGVAGTERDYLFTNGHSGEGFQVVLTTSLNTDGTEQIHALRLHFGDRSDN